MRKVTKEMKIRRYNELLFAKCIRIGDRETAAWFRGRLVRSPECFTNARALLRLYHEARHATEYGYHMNELMDGSGECGKYIYQHYDAHLRSDVEWACDELKISVEVAKKIVEEVLNTIWAEQRKWRSGGMPVGLCDQEHNWDSLHTALYMTLNPEKEDSPY